MPIYSFMSRLTPVIIIVHSFMYIFVCESHQKGFSVPSCQYFLFLRTKSFVIQIPALVGNNHRSLWKHSCAQTEEVPLFVAFHRS